VSAIVADRLTRHYADVAAIEDVSFEVAGGEVVALLGPNGAGKTTTLELLEGYDAPTAGTVSVLGADPRRGDRAWRARIGLVLQATTLDPQLTVREALATFAGLYPCPRPVDEVLETVDLEAEADTRIGRLSGGQQRRVDLGVAIGGRPELLILDEPTTGLDPAARRRVWAVIDALVRDGSTVVLSTHSMEEAERLAGRLLVLSAGRLVADAPARELRAAAGLTSVRYPLPDGVAAAELPAALVRYADPGDREIQAVTGDLNALLSPLVAWAAGRGIDLAGLEIRPPRIEDAYLALTDHPAPTAIASHG
jgi:ABC-2 type transport system ATP-binding protein